MTRAGGPVAEVAPDLAAFVRRPVAFDVPVGTRHAFVAHVDVARSPVAMDDVDVSRVIAPAQLSILQNLATWINCVFALPVNLTGSFSGLQNWRIFLSLIWKGFLRLPAPGGFPERNSCWNTFTLTLTDTV